MGWVDPPFPGVLYIYGGVWPPGDSLFTRRSQNPSPLPQDNSHSSVGFLLLFFFLTRLSCLAVNINTNTSKHPHQRSLCINPPPPNRSPSSIHRTTHTHDVYTHPHYYSPSLSKHVSPDSHSHPPPDHSTSNSSLRRVSTQQPPLHCRNRLRAQSLPRNAPPQPRLGSQHHLSERIRLTIFLASLRGTAHNPRKGGRNFYRDL